MHGSRNSSIVAAIALLSFALPTQAYVGPGAGVTLIGALIGLLSAIFLALFAVLRWPIRRFLARRRAARDEAATGETKPSETGSK